MIPEDKLAEYRKLVEKPTWWVDDITQRVCGPYSELEKLGWPNYDYIHVAINYETIKEPFVSVLDEVERLKKYLDIYTCNACTQQETCKFAFDHYNTSGDCLAEK